MTTEQIVGTALMILALLGVLLYVVNVIGPLPGKPSPPEQEEES